VRRPACYHITVYTTHYKCEHVTANGIVTVQHGMNCLANNSTDTKIL